MGKKISDYLKLNVIKGDKGIWMIYFLLCMISLVAIYSAGSSLTFKSGDHWQPVVDQAGFLLAGFLVITAVIRIPCKYFQLLPIVFLPIVAAMLLYVLLFQKGTNEAARWIDLGVKFQPSELAKSFLILAVAVVLAKTQKEEKVRTKKGTRYVVRATKGGHAKAFEMIGLMTCVICGLIAPENFSTAAMLFVVIVIMMFVGNVPIDLMFKGLAGILVGAIIGLVVLLTLPDSAFEGSVLKRARTWKHRIEKKLSPSATDEKVETSTYEIDKNRQMYTSHIAIANSNVIGMGVGNSIERDFLPHAESDFIFSIIVEETGVFGALIVIMLYISLLVRVGRIAQKCDRFFPAFLVIGLGVMMVLQALVNMAVAVGWAPVTGQTLPLISRGGTSIVITSFNIGMILSVSRYAEEVSGKRKKLEDEPLVALETEEIYSAEGLR